MTISYSITVCNELKEFQELFETLRIHKRKQDRINILFDSKNGSSEVEQFLHENVLENYNIFWHKGEFNGDFAEWKNKLIQLSFADYIFNLDADEMISPELIHSLPYILASNNQAELIWLSRINTVEGITPEYVQRMGWKLDSKNRINFPDKQGRIFKKSPQIYWAGKVHEIIVGAKDWTEFPNDDLYCIYHHKTFEKQQKQNQLYEKLT